METISLTYHEIAHRFGITKKSAENLRRRKGWVTSQGNDKRVRVQVPLDALPEEPRESPPVRGLVAPPVVAQSLPEDLVKIAKLEATVERWQAEAEYERERRKDVELDRDHWRQMAARGFWRRLFG